MLLTLMQIRYHYPDGRVVVVPEVDPATGVKWIVGCAVPAHARVAFAHAARAGLAEHVLLSAWGWGQPSACAWRRAASRR